MIFVLIDGICASKKNPRYSYVESDMDVSELQM